MEAVGAGHGAAPASEVGIIGDVQARPARPLGRYPLEGSPVKPLAARRTHPGPGSILESPCSSADRITSDYPDLRAGSTASTSNFTPRSA